MATKMAIADLKISREKTQNSQRVAVLNAPRDISMAYADIPEPGPGEVRAARLDGLQGRTGAGRRNR